MADGLYKTIHLVGTPFRFQIYGMENIREHNQAIFASNHAGSAGPIAITTSLPLRLYPWAIGDMVVSAGWVKCTGELQMASCQSIRWQLSLSTGISLSANRSTLS